jgi:hypothetical protein
LFLDSVGSVMMQHGLANPNIKELIFDAEITTVPRTTQNTL